MDSELVPLGSLFVAGLSVWLSYRSHQNERRVNARFDRLERVISLVRGMLESVIVINHAYHERRRTGSGILAEAEARETRVIQFANYYEARAVIRSIGDPKLRELFLSLNMALLDFFKALDGEDELVAQELHRYEVLSEDIMERCYTLMAK